MDSFHESYKLVSIVQTITKASWQYYLSINNKIWIVSKQW